MVYQRVANISQEYWNGVFDSALAQKICQETTLGIVGWMSINAATAHAWL